ncbi:hypothetical protein [Rothia uropygioeca]|uniref:hypothetical protein n=1 Tax=Kocuria sp. 257 TaxID=2021970 RepID=UPI0010123738|nr:hypothetical protein [Kocuria sp. 257]
MALRFNPPPHWPQPPEGWSPDPGWRPDPSWGPAPQGWFFWTDENGNPVPSAHPEDPSFIPDEPQQAPQPHEEQPGDEAPDSWQNGWGSSQASRAENSQTEGPAPTRQYQQQQPDGWGHQGQENPPPQGSGWNGNPRNQPPRKKNFFATSAGILSIIGAILLILVIGLVLALTGVFGNTQDSGDSKAATSSSASESGNASDSANSSPEASASGDGPSGMRPEQANIPANDADPVVEFTGEGSQKVKTDKLEDGQVYYVEYWYQGDSNFALWGLDDKGEDAGLYANDIDETSGSSWIDMDGLYGNPKGFNVDATDGKWEIKVYDGNAIKSEGDKTMQSNGTVAFVYQGPKKSATFENLGDDSFEVEAYDLKGDSVFHENVTKGNKANVNFPDATKDEANVLVQVKVTDTKAQWKMSFK